MQEVMLLVAVGVLVGLPVAYALTRLMNSQLYGVAAGSAGIFGASVAIIAVLAALAGLSRRARQHDRSETGASV